MAAPEPGLSTKVEYVRAVDGDTIEFEIRRTFKIRLRDIDVYELDTDEGVEALEYVDEKLNSAEEIIVFIPSNDPVKFLDINSFERLVGDVYVDGRNLRGLLRVKRLEDAE